MNAVTIVANVIAVAVPLLVIYLFYTLDIYGTGNTGMVALCVAWGAVGAYSLAVLVNTEVIASGVSRSTLTRVTAPMIEEVLKAMILAYLLRQPSFRYVVDGAVYGLAAGIGFGLSENVLYYLPESGEAVLGTAIIRTLSTLLMHATASALFGISLGRLRRSTGMHRTALPLFGIGLAIALHVFYNNVVSELGGLPLLLVAIGIGMGGGMLIAWQITQALTDEKQRFSQTLGANVDVSVGEREAIQRYGDAPIEIILDDLTRSFGHENVNRLRRLLMIQANIGILQHNLSLPVSARLHKAWQEEMDEYQAEMNELRDALKPMARLYLQTVFPIQDAAMQEALNDELGQLDPTMVDTFHTFMRSAELAEDFTPEQLVDRAARLQSIGIFSNVSLANLENLSRSIIVQTFPDGTRLFEEGDEGHAMYLLEDGQIEIFVQDTAGRSRRLRTFEAGHVVGELALLDGQQRSASAVARGEVRALVLQRVAFKSFVTSRPRVVMAVLQYLAEKVRYTTLSVEQVVDGMAHLGQGDYALPDSLAVAGFQPVGEQPGEAPSLDSDEFLLDPEDVSEATQGLVYSALTRTAAALQRRERLIRTGKLPRAS